MDMVKRLDNIRAKLLRIGASDGESKIDSGILETVAILNVLEINTILSSAGRPWIDVPEIPNCGPFVDIGGLYMGKFCYEWNELDESQSSLTEEQELAMSRKLEQDVSEMQEKLLTWLNEFYQESLCTDDIRLVISRPERDSYVFTFASQGAWIKRTYGSYHSFLRKSQAEMDRFTNFLKAKYSLSL